MSTQERVVLFEGRVAPSPLRDPVSKENMEARARNSQQWVFLVLFCQRGVCVPHGELTPRGFTPNGSETTASQRPLTAQ